MSEIVPVILCGGMGLVYGRCRAKSLPKQFAPLLGAQSLFETTVSSVDRDEFADPIVVTSNDHRFLAEKQMRDCGCSGSICQSQQAKTPPLQYLPQRIM